MIEALFDKFVGSPLTRFTATNGVHIDGFSSQILLEWANFDRLGAFRYSDEEGTHAHTLDGAVSKKISYNRWRKVMALGRRTSKKRNKALIGQTLDVLVESPADDQGFVLVGRHQGQSPEIDGVNGSSLPITTAGPEITGALPFVCLANAGP